MNKIRPIEPSDNPVYKLTDAKMQTYKGFQWELGVTKRTSGEGPLCTKGWLHVYTHPDLGVLFNTIHADFPADELRLFRGQAEGVAQFETLKAGVSGLTLLEEMQVPVFTSREQIAWIIHVVRAIPGRALIPVWEEWADALLMGVAGDAGTAKAAEAAWAVWDAAAEGAAEAEGAAAAAGVARSAGAAWAAWGAGAAWAAWDAAAVGAAAEAAEGAGLRSLLLPHEQFLAWRAQQAKEPSK